MFKNDDCYYRLHDYFLEDTGATKFGYLIMNLYFIEEKRFLKEIYENYIEISKLMNNLTLTGLEKNIKKWPLKENELETYINNDSIKMFNDFNFMFSNIIVPFLDNFKKLTIDSLNKYLNDEYQKYNIFIIIYLCIIIIGFFLFWVLFVNKLNSTIYRTKNMLIIIPIEVLYSTSNIENIKINKLIINNHLK